MLSSLPHEDSSPFAASGENLSPPASPTRGRLEAFWDPDRLSPRTATGLFLLLLCVICGLRAFIGLAGTRVYSHDGFMVIDGAWRMANGQRPHVDFNSMIGPAAYLPALVGLRLSHFYAQGFGYGQALTAFVLALWAYALGAHLRPVPRTAYALLTAAIAGSPAVLGPSPFWISPGMTYNRYSYALLGLLLLECVQPEPEQRWLPGASSGVILGILAFLKITTLGFGAVLIAALAFVYRKSLARWIGLALGLGLTTLAFLAYLHFRVDLVLQDLAITAAAKHIALADRYDFYTIFLEAGTALVPITAVAWWLATHGRRPESLRLWRLTAIVLGMSLLILFGNFQRSELPLATLLLVLVVNEVIGLLRRPATDSLLLQLSLLAGSITVAASFFALGLSLSVGVLAKLRTAPGATHFATPILAPFVPVTTDHVYTYRINDGLQLLAKDRRPGESLMSLDFTNAFTYGLGIPPAPGGSTNLQLHGSFNETHFVPAEKLFGQADLVMIPKEEPDENLLDGLALVYGAYLKQHFALAGESADWKLYRRIR